MYRKKLRRRLTALLYALACLSILLSPAQAAVSHRVSDDALTKGIGSGSGPAPLPQWTRHASLQAGSITIHNNNFEGNQDHGLNSDIPINAKNNWWGDANGPTHASNPDGNGDSVSDNVDFDPWLPSAVDIGIPYSPPPEPGTITLSQNSLEDNGTYGVQSSIPLNAENNWWGHPSGPYHSTLNPDGQGDNVSDNVNFDPWLTTPPVPPATFAISGHVRDGSGNPIPEATVSAGTAGSATTDASGAYTISGLPAGTYTLTPSKSGWTFSPPTLPVSLPPDQTGLNFTGTAHPIDLSVDSALPVQVLEGQNLVKGKATAVKVVIRKSGTGPAFNVSVRLNYGSSSRARFYVAEPSNTNSQYSLVVDNTSYPLHFATSEITKTIYFFGDSLAPTASTFQASATVDYLGEIDETDETNNITASPSVAVHDTRWSGLLFPNLYLHYFRTDWGATPLSDFDSFYQASNDFFEGVYPVSEQRFTPDRSSTYVGDTRLFRGFDGKLSTRQISLWMGWVDWRVRLAHPTADKLIATVPSGWFAQTTSDQANAVGVSHPNVDLVIAEALTTPQPNDMPIAAHEIGHKYGLPYGLPPGCAEEYENCNPFRQDGIGNYASPGLWVGKRIPIQVSTVRKVYCFMGAYKENTEYWIDATDYAKLLNDHKATVTLGAGTPAATTKAILAIGMSDITGTVTLDNWYVLPEAELSILAQGPYTFEYQDASGGVLYQQSFDLSFTLEGGHTLAQSPFVFTIPYLADTARIVIKHNNVPLAQKFVSSNAPVVKVVEPNGGEQFSDQITIRWSGSDNDGDALYYALLFSLDNGVTWETVVTDLTATSYTWSFPALPAGSKNLIKVIATDGINTGQDASDAPFTILGNIYLPLVLRNN